MESMLHPKPILCALVLVIIAEARATADDVFQQQVKQRASAAFYFDHVEDVMKQRQNVG